MLKYTLIFLVISSMAKSNVLAQASRTDCLECHKEMGEKIKTFAVIHGAMITGQKCMNCHLPHPSDKEKLLKTDVNQLCLGCHNHEIRKDSMTIENIGYILKNSRSVHDPVTSSGCTVCHNPHYGERYSMLAGAFPAKRYNDGTTVNNELCFICHNSELLDSARTIATGFRNGSKNLHYLHSAGERGRNCLVCHDVHGAPGPRLIKDHIVFGQWNARMIYNSSGMGGSCATACHGTKSYNRETEVKNDK